MYVYSDCFSQETVNLKTFYDSQKITESTIDRLYQIDIPTADLVSTGEYTSTV